MSEWREEDYKFAKDDFLSSGFFLPVRGNDFKTYGWIGNMALGYDLLEATRENPLFKKWECKHTQDLKKCIQANTEKLKEIREKQRLQIFKNLKACEKQQEKRTLINHFLEVIDSQPKSDWLKSLQSKLREKRDELDKQAKNSETATQIGRPQDFDPKLSKKWFNELKTKSEYQHKNGNPHKRKIREEIIERHKRKENGQVIKPSLKTIKRHTS